MRGMWLSALKVMDSIRIGRSDWQPDLLEDFWQRRANAPRFEKEARIFGQRVLLLSNAEAPLAALDWCVPLYSSAPPLDQPPFQIQLIVQTAPLPLDPAPDDLMRYIQYAGEGEWIALQLGQWGHAQMDLTLKRARAVVTPQLAHRPEVLGRCLLNTLLTNFFIASGYGLLHATCLVRDDTALLLMAPHNVGKSTLALRLFLAGDKLLTDSMVFIAPHTEAVQLLGFPVGQIKLRADMAQTFPDLQPLLQAEPLRGETKYRLDLRRVAAERVQESVFTPTALELYLLQPDEISRQPIEYVEMWEAMLANSLYYDTEAVWQKNRVVLERVLAKANCWRVGRGGEV